MKTKSFYQAMNMIYEHLMDEESKLLFDMRINFLITKNQDDYMERLREIYHDWTPSKELEEKISVLKPKEIIIFGCGFGGKTIKRMLPLWGYAAAYFCDNYQSGKIVDGLEVLAVDDMIKNHRDCLIIISSYEYAKDIFCQLINRGISKDNILADRMLIWSRGNQYLDVFKPQANEVYVDAGGYDGTSIITFYQWAGENYKKSFVFEPVASMCDVIRQRVVADHIPEVEICNYAVWNKKEKLMFAEDDSASLVTKKGEYEVSGIEIDSVVKNEKVTFIKMDVEGSELNALEGAKQTILKNHPRLAICIYHKPEDIVEIPFYILKLVPEYKFYIRHYTSHMWETVLYAEV